MEEAWFVVSRISQGRRILWAAFQNRVTGVFYARHLALRSLASCGRRNWHNIAFVIEKFSLPEGEKFLHFEWHCSRQPCVYGGRGFMRGSALAVTE